MTAPLDTDPGALLAHALRSFGSRMTEATGRLPTAPTEAAEALEALLAELPAAQAESLPWAEQLAQREGGTAQWVVDQWHQWLGDLHLTCAMARYRIGDSAACAVHLRAYLQVTQGQQRPQRAMALDMIARQALDAGRPDLAREQVDAAAAEARRWTEPAAWAGLVPEGGEAQAALQAQRQCAATLALRADVDLAEGDREAYLAHSAEALALWSACGADADVRVLWWARMQYELLWDASGRHLDQADEAVRAAAPAGVRDQPDFQRRLLQVRAAVWAARGRHGTARGLLQKALALMDPADFGGWSLQLDLADAWSAEGRHDEALAAARRAADLVAHAESPALVRRCADHLHGLQLASGDPAALQEALDTLDAEHDDGQAPSDTVSRLQTRVTLLLALKRPRDALVTVAQIEATPAAVREQSSITEAALAMMKAASLREDGRVADAAAVLEQAFEAGRAREAAEAAEARNGTARRWRDGDLQRQALAQGAALQHADLGDAEAALVWSERARGELWHAALARHGHDPAAFDLARARRAFTARRAAVLVLLQGRRRTAAVVMPADGGAAWCRMLPVGEAQWRERLADMERGEASWNPRFADNLPIFSAWLGPLLGDAVGGADLLCIVPEGALALLPWSGLSLPDGRPLALHVASALLPALQFGVDLDRAPPRGQGLLSVGAGASRDNAGRVLHDFDAMADELARAVGSGAETLLDAPVERFLREAPAYAALHLSLHGNVQPGQLDPLAASTLEFQGQQRLSARRLAECWDGGVDFDHVFVNACVSAGYAFARDAGAGGFWQALLGAGARAVTGTLAYVDPGHAQALALGFHRHEPGRVGVPQALCAAQRAMVASGLPPAAWATHTTVLAVLPTGPPRPRSAP